MSRIFEYLMEIVGWLLIVCSPLLIGLTIGIVIYLSDPNETRLIIGIALTSLGLLVGILWATRIWKTTGTMWFLSRIMATPELDGSEEDKMEEDKTE